MENQLSAISEKLHALISDANKSENFELMSKLLDVSEIVTAMRSKETRSEVRQIKRQIAKSSIELWKLPEYKETYSDNVRSEILELVDTRSGKITSYVKESEHIHEGIRDGETFTSELFGANGFKRLKLVEDSLKEIEEE